MGFADHLAAADGIALDLLGGPVHYTSSVGEVVSIRGIFDPAYRRGIDITQPGVAETGPAVFLRLADLPVDPAQDPTSIVTIDGTRYRVREAQKDGQGGVLLHLLKS